MVFPYVTSAQTLIITNGVQTYSVLNNNTVVTMTGRSELRLTAASNPIPNCTINLNSPDAWVLLPNIRPSVVQASYLGQFVDRKSTRLKSSNLGISYAVFCLK